MYTYIHTYIHTYILSIFFKVKLLTYKLQSDQENLRCSAYKSFKP